MSHSSLVHAQQGTICLERTEPTVSFDTRLGQVYDSIDFDTVRYTSYLNERGLSANQVANASVHFEYAPLVSIFAKAIYNRDNSSVRVNVNPFLGTRTLNKAVYHETEHIIAEKTETTAPVAYNIAANSLRLLGLAASILSIPMVYASNLLRSETLYEAGHSLGKIGIYALISSVVVYYGNPEERRALRVARNSGNDLVGISR